MEAELGQGLEELALQGGLHVAVDGPLAPAGVVDDAVGAQVVDVGVGRTRRRTRLPGRR